MIGSGAIVHIPETRRQNHFGAVNAKWNIALDGNDSQNLSSKQPMNPYDQIHPIIRERLKEVAEGQQRDEHLIIEDALIRQLGMEGLPIGHIYGKGRKEQNE